MSLKKNRGGFLASIGLAVAVPAIIMAAVPNMFNAGDVISSGKVNANFNAVDSELASLRARLQVLETKVGAPSTKTTQWCECQDFDVGASFDLEGWGLCPEGYFLTGLYRNTPNCGATDNLGCLEKFKCCRPCALK